MMRRTCLILLAGFIAACSGGGGSDSGGPSSGGGTGNFSSGGGTPKRLAIDGYVNEFIIPILVALDDAAGNLQQASNRLAASPTAENLAAARSAWVATRIPWEQSEAALFGPVDFYGFDPALDSWPVNRTDLDGVLASNTALTEQSVANFDNALKGFHTIEYLIYGNLGEKTADQLTAREGEYLTAAAAGLKNVTASLRAAWVSGFNGQPPYAQDVVNAGQGSSPFPSENAAIEQFVGGIVTICDEVANGKIADPFDQRDPNIVESQFSGNSLQDFADNIIGARSAYVTSLADLVRAANPDLDARTVAAFDAAIGAIRAIPEPFLASIQSSSNDAVIRAAQAAVRNVLNIVQGEVLPVVLG